MSGLSIAIPDKNRHRRNDSTMNMLNSPRFEAGSVDVEIFDNLDRGVYTRNLPIHVSRWEFLNRDDLTFIGRILERMCKKLVHGDINYSDALSEVLHKILLLLDSEFGSFTSCIPSLDQETTGVKYLTCVSVQEKEIGASFSDCNVNVKNAGSKGMSGIFGYAINNDLIIISNNLTDDPRIEKLPVYHPHVSNFLTFPLKYKSEIIGMVSVCNNKYSYTLASIQKFLPLVYICSELLMRTIESKNNLTSHLKSHQERCEIKELFLSTMSSELRKPLDGIAGIVSLLPDAGPLNEKQTSYIRKLTESTIELTSLLNNVIDFTKLISNKLILKREDIDVKSVIANSIEHIWGCNSPGNIDIITDIQENLPIFIGDGKRLTQVLTNLLGNADKYTERGSISVGLSAKKINSRKKSFRKWKLIFKIKDTGIGIYEGDHDMIFEAFNQVSINSYINSGNGLGLAIVKELVRMMDGQISISSSGIEGQGSVFAFYITLDEQIDISKILRKNESILTGVKILVVDSDSSARVRLVDNLFKWGTTPFAVGSEIEAMQYIKHGIDFKIAFINKNISDRGGVKLARDVLICSPLTKLVGVCFTEGLTNPSNSKRCNAPFDIILSEEATPFVILKTIISLIRRRRPSHRKIKKRVNVKKARVLLIQSDENNIFTLTEILRLCHVRHSNIKIVRSETEYDNIKADVFDIYFIDIKSTKINSYKILKNTKCIFPSPSIIALGEKEESSCNVYIDFFITKPIMKRDVTDKLQQLVYRRVHKKPKRDNNK